MPARSAMDVSWSRPSARRFVLYLKINLVLGLLFSATYFGANWLAMSNGTTSQLHAAWERSIPFVPQAIVVYFSIGLLFWLPLFAFGERSLLCLARQFAVVTCAAGLAFVMFPIRIGFDRPPVVEGYEAIFANLYRFDAPYNTVPSLHIAYSTLILGALWLGTRSAALRAFWVGWLLAIDLSVLLVHQHHVIDVLAGSALGTFCVWRFLVGVRQGPA